MSPTNYTNFNQSQKFCNPMAPVPDSGIQTVELQSHETDLMPIDVVVDVDGISTNKTENHCLYDCPNGQDASPSLPQQLQLRPDPVYQQLIEFAYFATSDQELQTIDHALLLVSELQHFISNRNASVNPNPPTHYDHFWVECLELANGTVLAFKAFEVYVKELQDAISAREDLSAISRIVMKIRNQLEPVYWSLVPLEQMIISFYETEKQGGNIRNLPPSFQCPSLAYRARDDILFQRLQFAPQHYHSQMFPISLYNPYSYEFDIGTIPDKSPKDIGTRATGAIELLVKDPQSFKSAKERKTLMKNGSLDHARWKDYYVTNRKPKKPLEVTNRNCTNPVDVDGNHSSELGNLAKQFETRLNLSGEENANMTLMEIVFGSNDYHGFLKKNGHDNDGEGFSNGDGMKHVPDALTTKDTDICISSSCTRKVEFPETKNMKKQIK